MATKTNRNLIISIQPLTGNRPTFTHMKHPPERLFLASLQVALATFIPVSRPQVTDFFMDTSEENKAVNKSVNKEMGRSKVSPLYYTRVPFFSYPPCSAIAVEKL